VLGRDKAVISHVHSLALWHTELNPSAGVDWLIWIWCDLDNSSATALFTVKIKVGWSKKLTLALEIRARYKRVKSQRQSLLIKDTVTLFKVKGKGERQCRIQKVLSITYRRY
jgi:hypothetical protein